MAYQDVLKELGYTEDPEVAQQLHDDANDPATGAGSMSHNGEYKVEKAWTKGDVIVFLERNTAPEGDAGDDEMSAIVTHPPVLVVEKGGVRQVVVPPRDADAVRAVLTDVVK